MITETTTSVYVRVDIASNRVIAVSDSILVRRLGRPVFEVAANDPRLDHYVIESTPDTPFGITVRVATAEEITIVDTKLSETIASNLAKSKYQKAFVIKDFYDEIFIRRFLARGFMTTAETEAASTYSGTDQNMIDVVKPLAIKINNAYNEWRHGVCQLVINTMLTGEGLGIDLNDDLKRITNDELDVFLTARDFDIEVFHK
jgi:hypothetical protein